MKELTQPLLVLINAKLNDLDIKINAARVLPVLAGQVKGTEKSAQKITKAMAKLIGAEDGSAIGLQNAYQRVREEVNTYVTLTNKIEVLSDLGASDAELKGLKKFGSRLEKTLFKKLEITEESIQQIEAEAERQRNR